MSTPFDIPITQPSSGGGSLPYVTLQNDATETISTPYLGKIIPDFTLKITPTSATQKIYLSGVINGEWSSAAQFGFLFIKRDGTAISLPDLGNRVATMGTFLAPLDNQGSYTPDVASISFIDSPETTSEVTYTVFVTNRQNTVASFYLNRTVGNSNANTDPRMASTLTAQCFEP
jgi:hypothetical protein